MKKVNYPSRLLKIESGQQFSGNEISLFEDDNSYKKGLAEKVDKAITRIIELNQKNQNTFSIEFPKGVRHNISDEIKSKVVKELSAYEVRTFTAIVTLAQLANARSELYYLSKINRAYFEFTLTQIYRIMGIERTNGKKDTDFVKNALLSLHRKEFIYHEDGKFVVSPLIQIHKLGDDNNIWDSTLNITVDSCFFDFASTKTNQKTYFSIPIDLNKKLRKINKGRPNTSIELLIKYLYQSKHCSSSNMVEYGHKKLIDIMNLERHVKNRNYGRVKKTILKGFETAIEIGLINNIEEGKNTFNELKYIIYFK